MYQSGGLSNSLTERLAHSVGLFHEAAPIGLVAASRCCKKKSAWVRSLPHISVLGASETQTAGRSGSPNSWQAKAVSKWGHGMPAGLPLGRPGSGLLMDGAMQQAAQLGRQCIRVCGTGGRPTALGRPRRVRCCGQLPWRDGHLGRRLHGLWRAQTGAAPPSIADSSAAG